MKLTPFLINELMLNVSYAIPFSLKKCFRRFPCLVSMLAGLLNSSLLKVFFDWETSRI